MSILYGAMENLCFGLDKLSGGGIKSRMTKSLTTSTGAEKPPGWISRRCRVRAEPREGFPVFRFTPKGAAVRPAETILFLPGGGGMSRPTALHYDTACRLVERTGAAVYLPFYPLAPLYTVRDALEWLLSFYRSLCRRIPPDSVTFVGDSAGANLILSLCSRLEPEERPARLIVISPAFGLQEGRGRAVRLQMEPYDPLLTVEMNDIIAENWSRGVPLDSPDINPDAIDYHGFPDMLFLYGTHEIFYPWVRLGMKRIRQAGVSVRVIEKPLCHDWALCAFLPEGRQAMEEMTDFILGEKPAGGEERIWNFYAPVYDLFMRKNQEAYQEMYRRIRSAIQGKEVLELATGTGLIARNTASAARRMVATDFAENMLRQAERGHVPENLRFQREDAAALSFSDDSFDVVIIANALHIIPEPERVLREIRRVLRPGGLLIAPNFVHGGEERTGKVWSRLLTAAGIVFEAKWDAEGYCRFLEGQGMRLRRGEVIPAMIPLYYAECQAEADPAPSDC